MTAPDLVDLLPLPLLVILRGRVERANRAAEQLLGYGPGELVGAPFIGLVGPDNRSLVLERHARRLQGEAVPSHCEIDALMRDGTLRRVEGWIAFEGERLLLQMRDRTAAAARQGRLASLVELGARIQAQRSKESVFAAVLDGLWELGVAVTLLEEEGADRLRIVDVRVPERTLRAFEAAVGRPAIGLTGHHSDGSRKAVRKGSAFVSELPSVAAQFLGEADEGAMRDALLSTGPFTGIFVRIGAAGATWLLFVTADWLASEDATTFALFATQVSAALETARVIADLSERNAALGTLNRVAAAAAASTSLEGIFASVVPELRAALGAAELAVFFVDHASNEAVLEHHTSGPAVDLPAQLTHVDLAASPMGAVVRTGKARALRAADFRPEIRRLIEAIGIRSMGCVPLVARSRVVGVMNVGFADERALGERELDLMAAAGAHLAAAIEAQRLLADLRRSYQELGHAQEQLVQRERLAAIGELAAVVAHEVRNPLGVIFNSVGALKRLGPGVGSLETVVRILEEEAVRLNHIVSDLLDFARPKQPQLQPERLDAVLDDAVRVAVEGTRQVELIRDVAPGIPLVCMDARLVRQALLNVAINAVQAMPSGGRLLVSATLEGRTARVRIRDTGEGIPPEIRPRIFEPFFTTRPRGTGLGLAVVKRIIEGHGGAVEVTTEVGQGTSFDIILPIAVEPVVVE
jgi:signal transduction histidine kinase